MAWCGVVAYRSVVRREHAVAWPKHVGATRILRRVGVQPVPLGWMLSLGFRPKRRSPCEQGFSNSYGKLGTQVTLLEPK